MRWLAVLMVCGCGSTGTTSTPDGGGGADASPGVDAGLPGDTGTTADHSSSPDQGSMMMTGKSVDECFVGLRALKGAMQDATRTSADGKYRMRLALETADRGGTSGSYAWAAIRFALETPDGSVCVTDETALASAYIGSHHNCMDVLTVSYGSWRYVIQRPDSAVDYVDKTRWRREASLSAAREDVLFPPVILQTTRCNAGGCTSGGPCQ